MINNQATKSILKPLDRIASRGYHISSVFRDWVALMLYALCRQEEYYLEVMGRYKNDAEPGKREADYFASAFAGLNIQMAEVNHDLLGDVYMEIAGNYSAKNMGQFFTPHPVCDMMARLSIPNPPEKPVSVSDPACGSARNLISAAKMLNPDSFFVGIDLDTVCVQMAALNCCFFNMNALIFHGNTLEMTFYTAYRTKNSVFGGSVWQLPES